MFMKKMIAIAAVAASLSANAFWNNNGYNGYNGYKDNGFFGYNPYSVFTPNWFSEEMENMFDEFDGGNNYYGPRGNYGPRYYGPNRYGNNWMNPWNNNSWGNTPWGNHNGPWNRSTWRNNGYNKPVSTKANTPAKTTK